MRKLKLFASLSALAVLVLVSCGKKYPDGGKIKKASENIQGVWSLDKYYLNGTDKTAELIISNMTETYTEGSTEGAGTLTRSYTDDKGDAQTQNGNYKFDEEYTVLDVDGIGSIEFTTTGGTASTSTNEVLKLTSDDYAYSFTNGGDVHEFHFVKQ